MEKVFVSYADTWTVDTGDASVLCIGRYYDGEKVYGVFNFSEFEKTAWLSGVNGEAIELISGNKMKLNEVKLPAYGFYYLKEK